MGAGRLPTACELGVRITAPQNKAASLMSRQRPAALSLHEDLRVNHHSKWTGRESW